jgi:hypothetical protein
MNREILFRGLRADGKGWVEGDLLRDYWVEGDTFIPFSIRYLIDRIYSFPIEVPPSSVGQFTGLLDKNDVKIFEGDKVLNEDGQTLVVMYFQNSFSMRKEDGSPVKAETGTMEWFFNVEVIGNIHEGGQR